LVFISIFVQIDIFEIYFFKRVGSSIHEFFVDRICNWLNLDFSSTLFLLLTFLAGQAGLNL
jgi:hypothetical protein